MNYRFLRYPGFLKKAFTLNYDDGCVFDEKMIGIMKKHGIRGTFNLNTNLLGTGRHLSVQQALELYEPNGMEIQCHGFNHRNLTSLPRDLMVSELYEDRKAWETALGHQVHGMAYAFGTVDDTVEEVMKSLNFWFSRTTVCTEKFGFPENWLRMPSTCHHKNPRLMELCDKFLATEDFQAPYNRPTNGPLFFQVWGHSYEFNDNDNWEILENLCEKIGGRDDIWYATTGEVYRYVRAFEQLEYSLDGTLIHNPTATDVYLQYFGFQNIIIHAGETVKVEI